MPVVIHEFEVVAEPPAPPAGESAPAEAAPPRPAPRDVERVLRWHLDRSARVRAT